MKTIISVLSWATFVSVLTASCNRSTRKKVSHFGEYFGYSEAIYDGYQRTSQHLMLGDRTRLAYDLYLPTKDCDPTGEPFEMVFDLLPTSYQFQPGNRIRITLAFADADNFDTPILDPPPNINLLRNPDYPSYVILPVRESLLVPEARKI